MIDKLAFIEFKPDSKGYKYFGHTLTGPNKPRVVELLQTVFNEKELETLQPQIKEEYREIIPLRH